MVDVTGPNVILSPTSDTRLVVNAVATLRATATLAASATRTVGGPGAALAATATLSASGVATAVGTQVGLATLTAASTLAAAVTAQREAACALAAAHTTAADALAAPPGVTPASVALGALAVLSAAGGRVSGWLARARADQAAQVFEFDEGSGTTAVDKSGFNRHGTYVNGVTHGQAGVLAGERGVGFTRSKSNYVSLNPDGLPAGNTPYAIEMVFRPNVIDNSQGLANLGTVNTTNRANGILLAGSENYATLYNPWWGNDLVTDAGKRMLAGQNYHVVVEYDGTTRRIFLNGTLLAQAAASGFNALVADPRLGWWNGGTFFDGTIIKAAVYTGAALGEAKARQHYEAAFGLAQTIQDPRDIPGLLAWYSVDDLLARGQADGSTLTTWPDLSGKGNHGTAVNTPVFRAATANERAHVEYDAFDGHSLPDVFAGKDRGLMLMQYKSDVVTVSQGGPQFSTYVAGGQHYPHSNNGLYTAFGSPTRRDAIIPHTPFNYWNRMVHYSGPGEWWLRQNEAVLVADANPSGVSFPAVPIIGQGPMGGTGGRFHKWTMALVYDRRLTDAEQTQLDVWAAANPGGGRVVSRPVTEPVATLTGAPLDAAAYVSWGGAPYAETYQVRVNGGAVTDVGTAATYTATGLTNGTPATIEVRGVSPLGTGPWRAVTVTPTTTYLFDLFDRPNSSSVGSPIQGGPYTVSGTFSIASNALAGTAAENRLLFPAHDDVDIEIAFAASPAGGNGIIVRYGSATDLYLLQPEGVPRLALYHWNGAWTVQQAVAKPTQWAAGDRTRVRAVGRYLYCYINDVCVMVWEDFRHTGAKHTAGLRIDNATARIDRVLAVPGVAPSAPLGYEPAVEPARFTPHKISRAYKGRDTKALDMESEA